MENYDINLGLGLRLGLGSALWLGI